MKNSELKTQIQLVIDDCDHHPKELIMSELRAILSDLERNTLLKCPACGKEDGPLQKCFECGEEWYENTAKPEPSKAKVDIVPIHTAAIIAGLEQIAQPAPRKEEHRSCEGCDHEIESKHTVFYCMGCHSHPDGVRRNYTPKLPEPVAPVKNTSCPHDGDDDGCKNPKYGCIYAGLVRRLATWARDETPTIEDKRELNAIVEKTKQLIPETHKQPEPTAQIIPGRTSALWDSAEEPEAAQPEDARIEAWSTVYGLCVQLGMQQEAAYNGIQQVCEFIRGRAGRRMGNPKAGPGLVSE